MSSTATFYSSTTAGWLNCISYRRRIGSWLTSSAAADTGRHDRQRPCRADAAGAAITEGQEPGVRRVRLPSTGQSEMARAGGMPAVMGRVGHGGHGGCRSTDSEHSEELVRHCDAPQFGRVRTVCV